MLLDLKHFKDNYIEIVHNMGIKQPSMDFIRFSSVPRISVPLESSFLADST